MQKKYYVGKFFRKLHFVYNFRFNILTLILNLSYVNIFYANFSKLTMGIVQIHDSVYERNVNKRTAGGAQSPPAADGYFFACECIKSHA